MYQQEGIKTIEVKDLQTDIVGVAVNTALASNIVGDTSSIRIQDLDVSKANIDLKRDQSRQWQGLPVSSGSSGEKAFAWAISQVVLEESKVTIEDGAVTPVFTDELLIEKLRVENVGGEMVDGRAKLSATLGKYTPIQLEAEFSNQAGALTVKAKGEVNGLVLNHIDGYISNDLGHNFERGQLRGWLSLRVKSNDFISCSDTSLLPFSNSSQAAKKNSFLFLGST